MNTVQIREERFRKINRIFVALYYLLSAILIIVYSIAKDSYHLGISIGTLFVPPLIPLFYRILRLKSVHQLNFMVLAFLTLSYPLGSCVDLYRYLPGFDKVAHTLSGVFVSVLCLILYCALKKDHRVGREDAVLAIVFTFFGSMAVAGLWEICEYAASFITGRDLQRVAATGVADSMQDMLVCMAGTIVTLPFVRRLAEGRHDFITGSVEAFIEKNLI